MNPQELELTGQSAAVSRKGRPLGFVQIIEYQTSHIEELSALGREFRDQSANTPGVSKPLRGKVMADTDRPGYYLSLIEFESREIAMEASNRPETQEFFGRLSKFMDGPPKFYNLDVVEAWEMGGA
jgi:hypothetical protein